MKKLKIQHTVICSLKHLTKVNVYEQHSEGLLATR